LLKDNKRKQVNDMPMGMPYPKGNMAMKKAKPSMSEMMGVGKKPPMPPAKGKGKGKGMEKKGYGGKMPPSAGRGR